VNEWHVGRDLLMGVVGVIMCYGFKARTRIMGIPRWMVELSRQLRSRKNQVEGLWRDHGIEKTMTVTEVKMSELLIFTKGSITYHRTRRFTRNNRVMAKWRFL
jgi:hypothetical protein